MFVHRLIAIVSALFLLAGCSDGPTKSGKFVPNSSVNGGSNGTTTCGNGTLDPGENCDPTIADGAGACPAECPTSDEMCGTFVLEGTAAACSAICVLQQPACGEMDGCCPTGCDSTTDTDCTNTCGDGVVEGPELCDGDCPATCDDGVACTDDTLTGDPATCSAACTTSPITTCASDDGCCPAGCTVDDDNDCSGSCGDGTIDQGELCDGDCPTSCDDGVACTRDTLVGSAATCSAQCSTSPITACQNGDGCCPTGCTFSSDDDCNCAPSTCNQLNAECGVVGDGCGSTLDCGGCSAGETCVGNTCQISDRTGDACTSDSQCGGGGCLDESSTKLPGGYCTTACSTDGDCASGNCYEEIGICVDSCTSDTNCRTGYECFDRNGDGSRECWPVANGTGSPGDSCSGYSDCSGGQTGFCITSDPDFAGGYCTQACTSNSQCPSGSNCFDGVVCADNCTSNSNCRTGYACLDQDQDGTSECWPSGTGVGDVGDPCTVVQDCDGDGFAICATANAENPNSWPDGYCSILCGNNGTTCPSGSVCFDPDGTGDGSFCLDSCTSDTECRSAYNCNSSLGLTTDVCLF